MKNNYNIHGYEFSVWCDEYGDWYYRTPHAKYQGIWRGIYGPFKNEDDTLIACLHFTQQYDKQGNIKELPYVGRDGFVEVEIWGCPLDEI
ncbi:hypothetical protein [Kamptonema sp. PCC 6506]|uniref:hypothetical protein n=1 Tax=Kamptonema sp. PCC 6506 TaxID=272129 RepID=UPI0001DAC7E8|nr:hypothetical protein [Kamptonema sp. PCC 6506]CBN54934.1 hypothetical protein OSCI_1210004 [Kamptonema sp. PCC 6506]